MAVTLSPVDVLVRDGMIARIEAQLDEASVETVDGQGALVLPGLVDAHAHIDERRPAGGARVLGLDRYGLEHGCVADLVLVPAETPGDALMRLPPRSLVLKRGRIVGG